MEHTDSERIIEEHLKNVLHAGMTAAIRHHLQPADVDACTFDFGGHMLATKRWEQSWRNSVKTLLAALVLCVGGSSLCTRASGQVVTKDAVSITVDAATIQQDPRLSKPVSISLRNAPIKEVLDRFSEQTGVEVSIEEQDPSSGYHVFVLCDKAPVGKMMNALYGVFSIQHGEWAWVRTGKPNAYRYTLHETPQAKNRIEVYHRIVSGALANVVAVMRKLAPMPMDERKRHSEELRKALLVDSNISLQSFFEGDDKDWFWHQASFFFNALTIEQQESVLAGHSVSVNLKSLPPDVYNQYHQSYLLTKAGIRDPSGKLILTPEPETVSVYITAPIPGVGQIAPAIMVTQAQGPGQWMGTSFLNGGIPNAIKQAWMLPGDSATDAAATTVVKEAGDSEDIRKDKRTAAADEDLFNRTLGPRLSEEVRNKRIADMRANRPLESRLEQLELGSSVPVVAVLPSNNPSSYRTSNSFTTPVGKPVQEFLNHLEGNLKTQIYKWRDGVLLVTYPRWFALQAEAIPYSLLSILHPDKAGEVSVTEWATFMSDISADQASWFAGEYRYSGDVNRLRQILLLIDHYPRALTTEGVSPDENTLSQLIMEGLLPPRDAGTGDHPRVRVELTDVSSRAGIQTLRFEWSSDQVVKWRTTASVQLPQYAAAPKRATISQ